MKHFSLVGFNCFQEKKINNNATIDNRNYVSSSNIDISLLFNRPGAGRIPRFSLYCTYPLLETCKLSSREDTSYIFINIFFIFETLPQGLSCG